MGSNCLFPIESHITCVFPGGSRPLAPPPPPHPPLDQCMQYFAVTKVRYEKKLSILIPPPPPLGIPKCIHGVWENNHSGLTRIQIVFPGSDNFGSNPLYFTFCIKTLPDMSSADNLCKWFGPRSGPTFCSGLIRVQIVCKGYQQMTM